MEERQEERTGGRRRGTAGNIDFPACPHLRCLLLRLVFVKGSRGDQDKGEWLTSEERRENELWTEGERYEYVARRVRRERETDSDKQTDREVAS